MTSTFVYFAVLAFAGLVACVLFAVAVVLLVAGWKENR